MDFVAIVDTVIDFSKDKINKVVDLWNGLEEDRKKLLIGCVACAAAVIVVAGIAYSLGKASGKKFVLEDEDF